MQIPKRLLKSFIRDSKHLIESYENDSKKHPVLKSYNDKQILRLEGKIEAWEALLKMKL